jgi:hypothetical protein
VTIHRRIILAGLGLFLALAVAGAIWLSRGPTIAEMANRPSAQSEAQLAETAAVLERDRTAESGARAAASLKLRRETGPRPHRPPEPVAVETLHEVAMPKGDLYRTYRMGEVTLTLDGSRILVSALGMRDGETFVSGACCIAFGVGRLDPRRPGPQILIGSDGRRAKCCRAYRLMTPDPARLGEWTVIDLVGFLESGLVGWPKDTDGDGRAEFELADSRFLYMFGPDTDRVLPSRFYRVGPEGLVDVSDNPGLRGRYREQMKTFEPACRAGSITACAAFVATASRAGELDRAWKVMEASHSASAWAAWRRSDESYPKALETFLMEEGFIDPLRGRAR